MDGTYAPQSPDLSSFLSSPTKQQSYQPTSQSSSYAPRSPVIPSFGTPAQPLHPYQQQNLHTYQQYNQQPHFGSPVSLPQGKKFSDYESTAYMPPIPALPKSHSTFGSARIPPSPNANRQPLKSEDSYDYKIPYDSADADGEYIPSPTMSSDAPRGRGKPSSSISSSSNFTPTLSAAAPLPQQHKNPNPNNIEIKTKFPVARIKRIMQADEEVGKVAQVTPVAVSKALELFMIALVSGAAEKARQKGGKRVTAQHLKMVVEGDEQFDFLSEIVGKVADVQEGAGGEGRKRKEKIDASDSDEEKKVKKGKGRRKRGDD